MTIRLSGLLIAAILAGCGNGEDQARGPTTEVVGSPRLVAVDSIVLAESDSAYLGQPIGMAVDEFGDLYVADAFSSQVYRYGRDGKLKMRYGAPGQGPGELQFLYATFMLGDAIVAVEARNLVMKLYDRETAHYRGQQRIGGLPGNAIPAANDTVWLGLRDMRRKTAIARWTVHDTTLAYLGALPDEYTEFPNIVRATGIGVVRVDDMLIAGFGPLNGLLVYDMDGNTVDTLRLPVRERRGVTRQSLAESGGQLAKLANAISTFWGIHRLPSGLIAVLHYDNEIPTEQSPVRRAKVFVSLVDLQNKTACVDQEVVFTGDTHPVTQIRGDTLFVLIQEVIEQRSRAWLRLYDISDRRCEWVTLDRRGGLVE